MKISPGKVLFLHSRMYLFFYRLNQSENSQLLLQFGGVTSFDQGTDFQVSSFKVAMTEGGMKYILRRGRYHGNGSTQARSSRAGGLRRSSMGDHGQSKSPDAL